MKIKNEKIRGKAEVIFYQVRIWQTESKKIMKERRTFWSLLGLNIIMVFVYGMIPAVMLYYNSGISVFGSVELIFYSLLKPLNAGVEAAGTLVILRFFTIILPFFIGAVLWVDLRRKEQPG